MTYGIYFLLSLLLTVVVELLVVLFAATYILKLNIAIKEVVYWTVFVNLFSLPYLWFVFPLFFPVHNYIYLAEGLIVIIEMFLYMKILKLPIKNAFVLSLVANAVSYSMGLVVLH